MKIKKENQAEFGCQRGGDGSAAEHLTHVKQIQKFPLSRPVK
jgi:hypothetical protein